MDNILKALQRTCTRCGHTWLRRSLTSEPKTCPGCTSPYWNRERTKPATVKAVSEKKAGRVQPPVKVVNKLEEVVDPERAAALYDTILRAVREEKAEQEAKQRSIKVVNKLETVEDPARAADLYERILRATRMATARREKEQRHETPPVAKGRAAAQPARQGKARKH